MNNDDIAAILNPMGERDWYILENARLTAALAEATARGDRLHEEYAGLVRIARKSMYPNDADMVTASVRRVNTIMRGDTPGRTDGWWPVLDSLLDADLTPKEPT